MSLKTLIADDHSLVREGLLQVLQRLDNEQEIFQAVDFKEVKELIVEQQTFDLILLDLNMPYMKGLASIIELRTRLPSTALVIVSASENIRDIHGAIQSGVNAYIPKSSNNEVMLNALRIVLSGGMYFPTLKKPEHNELKKTLGVLTRRQQEVILLLSEGKVNKEIARQFSISDKTVKAHLSEIFKRLNVSNRTQAVFQAQKLGLLERAQA